VSSACSMVGLPYSLSVWVASPDASTLKPASVSSAMVIS
jgi:hypothetical protein